MVSFGIEYTHHHNPTEDGKILHSVKYAMLSSCVFIVFKDFMNDKKKSKINKI